MQIVANSSALNRSAQWLSQRSFYLTAGLLWLAVALRSLLNLFENELRAPIIALLCVWLVLFLTQELLTRRHANYFPLYLVLQSFSASILLLTPAPADFYAILFGILSMQVIQRAEVRRGAVLIALLSAWMTLALALANGLAQGLAFGLLYTAGNALLASYALAAQRAHAARLENQNLAQQLAQANRELQAAAASREKLAGARERQHLARELHDAVTQTIFSMTLTTQSARRLMESDAARVPAQLERLQQLAESALAEMRLLIAELRPPSVAANGLAVALREHLAERERADNLIVTLYVEGNENLSAREAEQLFRIAQEALNNIVKHARVTRAHIALDFRAPCWMEIRDAGAGFDMDSAQDATQVGLVSMRERAADIGWSLQIHSSPTQGTLIRVEQANGASSQ